MLGTLKLALGDYVIDHEYEADAVDIAFRGDYDTILLGPSVVDADAPGMIRTLRRNGVETPVLCLAPGPKVHTELMACFDAGADDWMTVPFHRDELDARVEALVRRSRGVPSPVVTIGRLQLHLRPKWASVDGKPLHLTNKEWRLLEALALARKRGPMPSSVLLDTLYDGAGDQPQIKIIDVFVCKIRKKLREAGIDGVIETIWGRGYQLVNPYPETE